MEVQYFKEHSKFLNRDMEFKIYGQSGKLCLAIPSQNGKFYEWEDRGMILECSRWIDENKMTMVTCDSIDLESWSYPYDTKTRMEKHELWIKYIVEELMPSVNQKMNYSGKWIVTGASLGAVHATNLIFRFPQKFDQLLALSGVYDLDMFYGDYHDLNTYMNNPMVYIKNMPSNHPFMDLYKQSQFIFVVGQGAWEDECSSSLRQFSNILYDKHIDAWCDFWGYDVCHDWPWWRKQIHYFMEYMING